MMVNDENKESEADNKTIRECSIENFKSKKMSQAWSSVDEEEKMEVDDVFQKMGAWQVKVVGLMSMLKFPVAWTQLGLVFMAAPIPYTCTGSPDKCFDVEGLPCTNWTYDRSTFRETIITEWDLVCEKGQLANVAQMTFMIGILVGNIVFSIISDRYGRKNPLVALGIVQVVVGGLVAFVPWYIGFVILRFIHATAVGGTMSISFVLTMEVLNAKWRTIVGPLTHLPFNFGMISMAGIAYATRDWHYFQLAVSVPMILVIAYWWLVPESPRWLLTAGHKTEALALLQQVAKVNGTPIPEKLPDFKGNENPVKKGSLFDLFRTKNLRKRTLVIMLNWCNLGFSFYGMEQYLSHVGGNIFLNVAISGAVGIPGAFLSVWTLDRFGRKLTAWFGQLLCAVCCVAIILVPSSMDEEGWIKVTLAILGVVGVVISFVTMYLYSTELFPTVVRSTGLGAGSMCARIGSMLAPFAATLAAESESIPPALFGTTSLISSLTCLVLPETLNYKLPNTIEEGENFPPKRVKQETELKGYTNGIFPS